MKYNESAKTTARKFFFLTEIRLFVLEVGLPFHFSAPGIFTLLSQFNSVFDSNF